MDGLASQLQALASEIATMKAEQNELNSNERIAAEKQSDKPGTVRVNLSQRQQDPSPHISYDSIAKQNQPHHQLPPDYDATMQQKAINMGGFIKPTRPQIYPNLRRQTETSPLKLIYVATYYRVPSGNSITNFETPCPLMKRLGRISVRTHEGSGVQGNETGRSNLSPRQGRLRDN